jgi:hypothetical protein
MIVHKKKHRLPPHSRSSPPGLAVADGKDHAIRGPAYHPRPSDEDTEAYHRRRLRELEIKHYVWNY